MAIDRISSQPMINTIDTVKSKQASESVEASIKQQQTESAVAEESKQQKITAEEKDKLEDVVKGMNEFLQPTQTSLKFEMHEKLQEYYVTVIDDRTKEVVQEIPPKKLLDVYAAMTEFLGLVVDKKV